MTSNALLSMDLRTTFAANVVRLRRAKGLSQEALAHEAGVNRSYLARIETGRHYVGLEIIGKLAEALEVEPAELLKVPSRRTRSQGPAARRWQTRGSSG